MTDYMDDKMWYGKKSIKGSPETLGLRTLQASLAFVLTCTNQSFTRPNYALIDQFHRLANLTSVYY